MSFYDEILSGESYHEEHDNTATAAIDIDVVMAGEAMAEAESQAEALMAVETMRTNTMAKMIEVEEKHKDVELSGEARDLYVETLAALGGIYGFTGEADTTFKEKAQSVLKSIQVYARKFIAIVGKWIAKASTYFTGLEGTRKELAEAAKKFNDNTEIEIGESLVSKLKSVFGGEKAAGNLPEIAIFMIPKPVEGVVPVNNLGESYKGFKGVDKVVEYIKNNTKDGSKVSVFGTQLPNGNIALDISVSDKDDKFVDSKVFELSYDYKNLDVKPGKTTLGKLGIQVKDLQEELQRDPKDLRKEIDAVYKDIKDTLSMSSDLPNDVNPIAYKAMILNDSKIRYKYMMSIVRRYKAALKVAKMIQNGGDKEEKKEEK